MALRDYWPFKPLNLRQDSTNTVNTAPIPGVAAQEYGVSGTENFGGYIRKEDYNPDLDDWNKAVLIYDKMRRTDSMIRAMLQVIKLPLRGAHWQCNPASNDPVDQKIADFCSSAIFDDDAMEDSWDFVLRHILLMLDFGVSVLEKVWMVDTEGNYRFKRLAPRLPKTLREWHINREGKLVALVQYAPVTTQGGTGSYGPGSKSTSDRTRNGMGPTSIDQSTLRPSSIHTSSVSYQYLTIPAEYVAVFSLEREGDNYEGYSLLRNVYRNWWFKDQAYHVMGVGLDRWGVGIPIAQLEEGHGLTDGDKDQLREILQKVRANERAYMVMPEHVKFSIEPTGGGQGTQSHFGISWLDHNDAQIARNVLAGFLTMGRDPRGTLGFGSRLTDMFISSLNGIAKGIAGDIKKQLVRPLCDFNFDMSNRDYPDPVCLDLEQVDLDALVDVLAKLSGPGGVLTPQDEDEETLRKILGLPPMKGATKGKRGEGAAPGGAPPPPGAAPGAPGGASANPLSAAEMAGATGLPGMIGGDGPPGQVGAKPTIVVNNPPPEETA